MCCRPNYTHTHSSELPLHSAQWPFLPPESEFICPSHTLSVFSSRSVAHERSVHIQDGLIKARINKQLWKWVRSHMTLLITQKISSYLLSGDAFIFKSGLKVTCVTFHMSKPAWAARPTCIFNYIPTVALHKTHLLKWINVKHKHFDNHFSPTAFYSVLEI